MDIFYILSFFICYMYFFIFIFIFYFYFTVFCCVKKFSNDKMFWFFFFGSPEYSHLLKPRASGNLLLHTEPGWRKRVWAHTFTVRDFPYVRTVILREKDDKLFSFCCIFIFLFSPLWRLFYSILLHRRLRLLSTVCGLDWTSDEMIDDALQRSIDRGIFPLYRQRSSLEYLPFCLE